ncbi:hypothetical protein J2S14_001336 [Lederbergia wuyishanensis]|uniref:Uncharacterized protein n=1 Tax=Lederbergia wuyishanensis TaxID=1347903 RepID=A0ABU0D2A4_9BACI|nr:hypothetical protein [Lederbergia wuyishanensis]
MPLKSYTKETLFKEWDEQYRNHKERIEVLKKEEI